MKKYMFLILLAVISFSVSAQKAFFPAKSGTKLTYQSTDKKGKLTSIMKYTVTEVKGSGDNFDITYQVESLDNKEKPVYVDKITVKQRGDKMFFDMSNFLNKAAFQQEGQIPPTVEVTGNNLEIPLVPVPGTSLPDASVTMAMSMGFLNLKMSTNLTNRKVVAIEDVTVKAGTFNAFKFSGDVSGTVLGIKVNAKSIEWYAYGIGTIKTESYDKKGELESTLELVEIQQ